MMITEITYELTSPISYALKGEQADATFITISAPTSKNMAECAFLKQALFRALPKDGAVESEQDSDASDSIAGATIMTIISMSKDVELSAVLATARELFTSGLALVDGEVKMTKPLADSLSMDDLYDMTGEYMATFIIASASRKAKKS